jgi:short repeat uncharacterized protein DUF308
MQSPQVKLPVWYRILAVIVGLITIGLAFVFLAFPGLALLTVVFLLGFVLLVIGIDRLIAGITGHPFGWMPGRMTPGAGAPPGFGQSPPPGVPPRP